MALRPIAFVLAIASLTGCSSTYSAPPYSVTANRFADMQDLAHATAHGVRVGRFQAEHGDVSVPCRFGGAIDTPAGTFSAYLRDAIVSELRTAGIYSDAAPVTLTGVVEDVGLTSMERGQWTMVLTVYSSNGTSVQILERHDFTTSAVGSAACAQAADELVPAVQDLVAKLVHDPKFEALVAPGR